MTRRFSPTTASQRRTAMVTALSLIVVVCSPVAASVASPAHSASLTSNGARSAAVDVTFQAGAATGNKTTSYGATLPIERRIPISATSTRIVFSHPLTVRYDQVQCLFRESSSTAGTTYKTFTGAEWAASSTHSFDIPAGFVVAGSNRVYRFECSSGRAVLEAVAWSLKERPSAPAEITLTADPAKLTYTRIFTERQGGRVGSTRTVHEGDRIVLSGEAGAFPKASDSPSIIGTLEPRGDGGAPVATGVSLKNLIVNADGSRVSGTVPTGLSDVFFGNNLALRFSLRTATPMTDTTPGSSRDVQWATTVLAERSALTASTTNIKLHDSTVSSSTAARLAVRVSTTSVIPSGTIETLVDGSKVSSTTLWSKGTATVTLPVQPLGQHSVSVRYLGSSTVAPSTSQTVTLVVSR